MGPNRRMLAIRISAGGAAGLLAALLLLPALTGSREFPALAGIACVGLGALAGAATLPFPEEGRTLLLHSAAHFGATSALFLLLAVQFYGWHWELLLLLEGILALLYALIWLGRWIGWYGQVVQLRRLLGLDPGPSALKWRETLPYLPFALLVCDLVPLLLRWLEHTIAGAPLDLPVLTGLLLPYLLLPAVGFCSGLSLGRRHGLCLLYPVALFLCYLPMVFLLYNSSALFHCYMVAVPALAGLLAGWLWRRRQAG